jgi:hypothetical protein
MGEHAFSIFLPDGAGHIEYQRRGVHCEVVLHLHPDVSGSVVSACTCPRCKKAMH